jgi:predicted NAD-dependent protein-ADP-ribosyltransferase YbiA (DUF1768 family)
MYPCQLKVIVGVFKSAESAFQACKCLDYETAKVFLELNGYDAKKLGRTVEMRADWHDVKVKVMKQVLRVKFSDPVLRAQLQNVQGIIQEDNTWNDTFWGVCNHKGKNVLGEILMEIRDEQQ